MPFTFQPIEITRNGNEIELRGRLLTGAYFGPESIFLQSPQGEEVNSHIHTHGMLYPEDWPVLPSHRNTVLILHIPAPPAGFQIALVTGTGAVAIGVAANRMDIAPVLNAPEFWALQATLHLMSEEVDDPALAWFGIPSEITNAWYEQHIDRHLRSGRNLCIRVPLSHSRYIEFEMAGGVEYQDRVWIGENSDLDSRRVLLGYHSGHFSLPTLRSEELSWIAAQTNFNVSNLLWLATAGLPADGGARSLVETLVARVPGLPPCHRAAMSQAYLHRFTTDEDVWTLETSLGWINHLGYSQRNPESALSILKPVDFAFIREFFREPEQRRLASGSILGT